MLAWIIPNQRTVSNDIILEIKKETKNTRLFI